MANRSRPGSRAWAAAGRAPGDPAAAIPDLHAHCELLLQLGSRMVHVEQLQLGYWVDRLTTALMKAKRPGEASAWLERWFALPDRYRERSSESETERLKKRRARAGTPPRG